MKPELETPQPQIEKIPFPQKSSRTIWYVVGAIIVLILIVGLYLLTPKNIPHLILPQEKDIKKTNLIGYNPDMFSYFGMEKPLVDVVKLADPWKSLSGEKVKLDSHGWPLEDATILLWSGQQGMNGSYKLSFLGLSAVSIKWGNGHLTNRTYNPATNITSADLTCDDTGESNMQLSFLNTSGGVKDVKLIRQATRERKPSQLLIKLP